ncbi:TRAP transporter small permease [Virgibacillus sp. L01]|uniref:TRAP transporter small permease n=1 Tax=Virgibacillus sp. L01 TaxID=3457429 RepID=UPI003FD03257
MQKIINTTNFMLKHLLNVIMLVLVASVFMQVIFRFAINSPLAWTEELARYSLVWLTFLGAAYAMSQKAHIGVEFFVNLLSGLGKKILQTAATFVSLIFFVLMVFSGYDLVSNTMLQTSPVLEIPMGIVYAAIPVSGLLLTINLIAVYVNDMKKGGDLDDTPTV